MRRGRSSSPVAPLRRGLPQELESGYQPLRNSSRDVHSLETRTSPQKKQRRVLKTRDKRKFPAALTMAQKEDNVNTTNVDSVPEFFVGRNGHEHAPDVEDSDDEFMDYVEAILGACVGFIHLHDRLFAVEEWSKDRKEGTVKLFPGHVGTSTLYLFFHRINGIILMVQFWALRKGWCVRARWDSIGAITRDFMPCTAPYTLGFPKMTPSVRKSLPCMYISCKS